MNLEEYFSRIQYKGAAENCDYQTLKEIFKQHIKTVPFEGLSIQCGEAIDLALEVIYNKIVRKRRGGWCCEQNHLLFWVLKIMGYEVTMLGGSVYLSLQKKYSSYLAHLMLKVVVDGQAYIVDCSSGAYFQTWEPLELISGKDQPQVPAIFYLTDIDGVWHCHQIRRKQCVVGESFSDADLLPKDEYTKVYRFTLQERTIEDFLDINNLLQTSPDSLFRKKSLCTLQLDDGIRVLCGWNYIEITYNHKDDMDLVKCKTIKDEEVETVLREKFNLSLENKFVPVYTSGIYLL
ncbi:arylamine N-acetyltransferase, pineal gland isozyme NAT-10-like [Lissotriton helveticus]